MEEGCRGLVLVRKVENDFQYGIGQGTAIDVVHVGQHYDPDVAFRGDDEVRISALLPAGMTGGMNTKLICDEPSQRVVTGLAFGGLGDGPHQISGTALHELTGENRNFKIGHVVRGGDEASAGNFVAGV